ncbi:MAG: hypothetical protein KGQ40_15445, partial [Rhodospirillales bacterium]|nr:hypothetical protein [Rhodospirillales bacterium]
MRLLRDRSIGVKLGLASLGALVLLAALAWSALSAMTAQDGLARRVVGAYDWRGDILNALAAERAMQVAGREVQLAQTMAGVQAAGSRGQAAGARAHDILAQVAREAGPASQGELRRAMASVAAFRSKIDRLGDLRGGALAERDGTFIKVQAEFESRLRAVSDAVQIEDLSPSELAALMADLRGYEAAGITLRDTANRFLATGDMALKSRLAAADAAAKAHLQGMLKARVSPDFRAVMKKMQVAGDHLSDSAHQLFDDAAAVDLFVRDEVDPASKELESYLCGANASFARQAAA